MRWLRAGFLPLATLMLAVAATVIQLPYVVERPGEPLSLAACVDVRHPDATPVAGDYVLLTILVDDSTNVFEAVGGILDPDAVVVPRDAVIPHNIDRDAFFRDQRREFALVADQAAAVGLRAAGFDAGIVGRGATVGATQPGTPAANLLQRGDVIVAINGSPVRNELDVRRLIESAPLEQPLTVRVRRNGAPVDTRITPTVFQGRTVIGVRVTTHNPRVRLPVPVEVAAGQIGGPSAGLMTALTVYDKVEGDVDLARGRTVAGTGTIDDLGRVGPIGGAGLKVIAADRAGADVFLAPAANYQEAAAALPAGSTMQMVSVATFEQARRALHTGEQGAGEHADAAAKPCPYATAA